MQPRDLPLLLTSSVSATAGETQAMDRVRIQKAVFLLSMRGTDPLKVYDFEPYNWGPYSSQLQTDVRELVSSQYLATKPARYASYEATPAGEAQAAVVWKQLGPQEQKFIKNVRHYVRSRSFSALLREVYAAYPAYASASQFRG